MCQTSASVDAVIGMNAYVIADLWETDDDSIVVIV